MWLLEGGGGGVFTHLREVGNLVVYNCDFGFSHFSYLVKTLMSYIPR